MDLETWADRPLSKGELVRFIRAFAESLGNEPDRWENSNLLDFLNACSAWLDDMEGYFVNRGEPIPEHASWQLMAQMLMAARIYE